MSRRVLELPKKDYNYAFAELRKEGERLKKFVIDEFPKVAEKINDLKFNQRSVDSVTSAIDSIDQLMPKSTACNIPEQDPLEHYDDYTHRLQMSPLNEEEDVIYFQAEMSFRIAKENLTRYRDHFQRILDLTYNDIKNLFINENMEELNALLSENSWIQDLLADNNGELGNIAIQKGDNELLKRVCKSSEAELYLPGFLELSVKSSQVQCVAYLLNQGADPAPLLGTEDYYKNKDIVDAFTDNLITKGKELNAIFYKANYLYLSKKYDSAIELFDRAVKIDSSSTSDVTIISQYYIGLCNQYLKEYDTARRYFEKVISCQTAYSDETNIKKQATNHLNTIFKIQSGIDQTEEAKKSFGDICTRIKKNEILGNSFLKLFEPIKVKFLTVLGEQNSENVTEYFKEFKQFLLKQKFVDIRCGLSEKVMLAQEFKDIAEMKNKKFVTFTTEEKNQYNQYTEAISILDDSAKIIGKYSSGFLIESEY